MQTVLNLIAIFAAVVLFMRYAVRPAKPNFRVGERLPRRAVCENMVILGKRCAVTSRGSGIDHRKTKLKKLFGAIKKQAESGRTMPWCVAAYNARGEIECAFAKCKRTVGKAYILGHSGSFPRVYLFSECLVRCTCGNIGGDILNDAKNAFERHAALDGREEAALPDFLRFCLIGLFYAAARYSLTRDAVYDRGARDGEAGKVDLDYIINADYVGGLYSAIADASELDALLETNGIDKRAMLNEHDRSAAKSYAVVRSVVRSLDFVDEAYGVELGAIPYAVKRRAFKYLDIALPVLVAVYAVFTCIFASPRYWALFFIGSVVTYGLLRIPTLISTGGSSAHDFFGNIRSKIAVRFKKGARINKSSDRRMLYETAFIDEIAPQDNAVERGLTFDLGDSTLAVDFMFLFDGRVVPLAEMCRCDHDRGVVYVTADDESELRVETSSPFDCNAHCLRITVVNRGTTAREVKLCAVAAGIECDGISTVEGGIAVKSNDRFILLSCGPQATYGNNYRDVKYGGEPRFSDKNTHAVIGCKKVTVAPLAKRREVFCLTAGNTVRECERTAEFAAESAYFDYVDDCAAALKGLRASGDLPEGIRLSCGAEHKAEFASPNIDRVPRDGEIVSDTTAYNRENAYNVLSDGNLTAVLDNYGIEDIAIGKSPPDRARIDFAPKVSVAIGESSTVWSPTFEPAGKGNMRVVRGLGYTEYICAYNGAVCSLCVFAPKNIGIVFLLNIDNLADQDRNLDIMLSVELNGFSRCERRKSSVAVYGGARSLCISSSERLTDFTQYKEGYFSCGRIDRTTGFGDRSHTFAPALSVKKSLRAKGTASAAFCIARGESYEISLSGVERMLTAEKSFFGRLGKYKLDSDEVALNNINMLALYNAYTRGFAAPCVQATAAEFYFIVCAVKYVDLRAVRSRIIEYMSEFDICRAVTSPVDGLYMASAVSDYVRHSGDVRFLSVLLSAKDCRQKDPVTVSVGEYCMRVLDAMTDTAGLKRADTPSGVLERRLLIDALHFFPSRAVRRAGGSGYSRLLIRAADEYRRGVEYVKNAISVKPQSAWELLAYARALYFADDDKNAYNAIKKAAAMLFSVGEHAENLSAGYAAQCAALYTAITEYTLGMTFRANRVSFDPHISDNAPHSEVLLYGEHDTRVVIDGSRTAGNWTMRIGNVTYSSTCIDITRRNDRIVICRDGKIE